MVLLYPNYKIIAENWSYWRLEDGSVLKSRITMQKLRARPVSEFDDIDPPKEDPNNAYILMPSFNTYISTETIPSDNLIKEKVTKDKIWKGNFDQSDKEKMEKLDIANTNQGFSYYEIKFGKEKYLMIVGLELFSPRFTSKYDDQGEPVYVVDQDINFQMIPLTSSDAPKLSIDETVNKEEEEGT